MKKILSVLLFLFILNTANSQLSGRYVADFRKKVEYYISFLNDGQYCVDLIEHLTNDILDKKAMSIGHYTVKGNVVNLIDKIHNFHMKLDLVNDSLKMENSFCFMNGKAFGFKSTHIDMDIFNYLKDRDSTSVEKERAEYKIQDPKLYPIVYGDYMFMKHLLLDLRYCLSINIDSTYNLYFQNFLISEGNWTREGVELILSDKWLKCRFYLMIGDRVLISKLLPGDYESSILQSKEKTNHNH